MTTPPSVVGLDLSLTATGYACQYGERVIGSKLRGVERLVDLRDQISTRLTGDTPTLVMVEGYAYGRTNQAHQMGELGGLIRVELFRLDLRWVDVPPSTLKMYATGKGNAGKSEVLVSAVRRLGYSGADDNQADALWLRALGMALLGHPLIDLPATHLRAVDRLELPTGLVAA
jgi:Holliday junction resolvasome RuvABC endonuclease subunit